MERYSILLKKIESGVVERSQATDDPNERFPIPRDSGFIIAGWYNEKQLTDNNLESEDAEESKDVILKEEANPPLPHFTMLLDSSGNIFKTGDQVEQEFRDNNTIILIDEVEHYVIP